MDRFVPFVTHLRAALQGPLPGPAAQFRMAPQPRPDGELHNDPLVQAHRRGARHGGVLVLFYPHQEVLHLPLILRPTYEGIHSGQVGFPGGGQEESDADLTATALREAYEELHIEPATVTVLGHLTSLYIAPSNYLVAPTVGWTDRRPNFRIDPYEVANLVEVGLAELQDPHNRGMEEWQLQDRRAIVPFFFIHGQVIWGATAMMLSELLAILDEPEPGFDGTWGLPR